MIQQNDHIQSHIYCHHQTAQQKLSNKNVVVCTTYVVVRLCYR